MSAPFIRLSRIQWRIISSIVNDKRDAICVVATGMEEQTDEFNVSTCPVRLWQKSVLPVPRRVSWRNHACHIAADFAHGRSGSWPQVGN